jgi:hypothetical protein
MHLWQVPKSEEKSVQMVRGSSFRNDLLQNPYFRNQFDFKIKDLLRLMDFNRHHIDSFSEAIEGLFPLAKFIIFTLKQDSRDVK